MYSPDGLDMKKGCWENPSLLGLRSYFWPMVGKCRWEGEVWSQWSCQMFCVECLVSKSLWALLSNLFSSYFPVYSSRKASSTHTNFYFPIFSLFLSLLKIHLSVFCLYVSVHTWKGLQISLERAVSHHVVARNCTQDPWKSSQCSWTLSHLSNPSFVCWLVLLCVCVNIQQFCA